MKATKKQPKKRSVQNFNDNFKKSATPSKVKRKIRINRTEKQTQTMQLETKETN